MPEEFKNYRYKGKSYKANVQQKKSNKRGHIVWFHLYDLQKKGKISLCFRSQDNGSSW